MEWRDFVYRARGRDLRGAIFDLASLPKVGFDGADLHGASLSDAQLRGASFARAQLQGASLDAALLQGALLADAELQGASLDEAQLQGAWLENAQLQGASLNEALLHGADLREAHLQGASLKKAVLHGACLKNANLEGAALHGAYLLAATLVKADLTGASLADAQLQGASLGGAALNTTDLSNAFLWRAAFGKASTELCGTTAESSTPCTPATLRFPDAPEAWQPLWRDEHGRVQPWDNDVYKKRLEVVRTVFGDDQGRNDPVRDAMLIQMRDLVLDRLGDLDCANSDLTLASCDADSALHHAPPETAAWRKALEDARAPDDQTYAKALASQLESLVCSGDEQALYVVRGGGFQARLSDAGAAASDLIDKLANKDSKDCPVSVSLTDADRARLLQIKQANEAAKKPRG